MDKPSPQSVASDEPVSLYSKNITRALQSSDSIGKNLRDRQAAHNAQENKPAPKFSMQDRLLSNPSCTMRKRDKLKITAKLLHSASSAAVRELRTKGTPRLLEQVIPPETISEEPDDVHARRDNVAGRPNFSLPIMANNFRRFNARIGVVFVFQNQVTQLLSWTYPTQTISLIFVYTFLVLHPVLIPSIPPLVVLFYVLIPAYLSRHPPPPSPSLPQLAASSLDGPPLAPPKTIAPAPDFSTDFFRNMRDLQNVMGDFSDAHDGIVALIAPPANFSDEARSSALFLAIVAACGAMSIAAPLLPWHALALAVGYTAVALGHPTVQGLLAQHYEATIRPRASQLRQRAEAFIARDIVLDAAPETREVEVFELQRRRGGPSSSGKSGVIEYEPWVFGASSWEPRAPARISGDRVRGTRFFEDVQPPEGWEWQAKKWVLDLDSKEWVEARMLGDVEVETEGERWVYDIEDALSDGKGGAGARRGEWRRRRWVRVVRRKVYRKEPGTAKRKT